MAGLFDRAKNALNSDQGERGSDSLLDKGAQLADKATGGKQTDRIQQVREKADEQAGQRGTAEGRTSDPTGGGDRA